MRLSAVEIRDFRSLFLDESNTPFRIELGTGSNTLVGQNNCGKSNVLRAISLALDPNHSYDPTADPPGPRKFAHPMVTLTFVGDGSLATDEAALTAIDAFDQALHGTAGSGPSLFAGGPQTFGLEVAFVPSGDGVTRRERLVLESGGTRGTTAADVRAVELQAIAALRSSVRFVLISTGESIQSMLEGNFREILHSVVQDQLQDEFASAEQSRRDYVEGLKESLLGPLRTQLAEDVQALFPEIDDIRLSPEVSSIEDTLSHVGVSLNDVVSTPLSRKGTGVRGGVMVAMLTYLAVNATRSMVFAIEEPEAFLHPAAQEDLRDHLERVADVAGVSLLVTTHSPFIVSESAEGRVFCLAKDREGRTRVAESAAGDADHAPLVGDLVRQASIAQVLASAVAIPAGTKAVVLMEGEGDVFCLKLTSRVLGRADLLEGLKLRSAGGTQRMIAEAVITNAAVDVPVVLVVDNDEPGRKVKDTLCGGTFGFRKERIVSYWKAFDKPQWQTFPVEAEDVFAPELMQGFVEEHGENAIIKGKNRRPDGAWHYDLDQSAKELLTAWFNHNAKPAHLERWVTVIQLIRKAARLGDLSESPADIIAGAISGTTDQVQSEDGQVLVLAGKHDYARYQAEGALVLDADVDPRLQMTHVAFYSRAIQPEVPHVEADHPNLLFSDETVAQLRGTGKDQDRRVAEFVERQLKREAERRGDSGRVLLLSAPEDDATLRLDEPVKNTKQIGGRPVAWAIGSTVVPYRALAAGPTTTDELDHAIATTSEQS